MLLTSYPSGYKSILMHGLMWIYLYHLYEKFALYVDRHLNEVICFVELIMSQSKVGKHLIKMVTLCLEWSV